MPKFKVTLADESSAIWQAKNITSLKTVLAEADVSYTKVERTWRCKLCRKAIAEVQRTLCTPCWEQVLSDARDVWKDVAISETALQELTMSYFIDC